MIDYFIKINYSGRPLNHIQKYVNDLWNKYDTDKDGFLTYFETKPFYEELCLHRKDLRLLTS